VDQRGLALLIGHHPAEAVLPVHGIVELARRPSIPARVTAEPRSRLVR
jgi:hypothetical protein